MQEVSNLVVKNKERETYNRWEGLGLKERIYSIHQNFPCMKQKLL